MFALTEIRAIKKCRYAGQQLLLYLTYAVKIQHLSVI